jgi:putative ABC transport system permease protein
LTRARTALLDRDRQTRVEVTFLTLVTRNLGRDRFRTLMMLLGIAISVVAFVALRTVLDAWSVGAEYGARDRLSTRHKVSYGLPLPARYVEDIAAGVPGIRSVTYCDWFGGRLASAPREFFANLACADNAFEVYPEIRIDPAALARWKADKQGAVIGDNLARQLGLRVGDRVTLQGSFYPGDWPLTIDAIYSAPAQSAIDRSSFFFHWNYKNEGVAPRHKDMIGWIFTRVDEPARSAAISRAIDALFDQREIATRTTSERAANAELLGGVSAILAALDVVSLIVLAIMGLMLGNSIAMSVRERTQEFGVLMALGFRPRAIRGLILAEAGATALIGSALGLGLAYPLIQLGLGRWLEENVGQFFPAFRIGPSTMLAAVVVTTLLGTLAAALPARRVGRTAVSEALQRPT